LHFKNSFLGYFRFYYSVIGNKLLINLLLCILVSFVDGIGLAMFMPLLQAAGQKGQSPAGKESSGALHYITDLVTQMGLPLTVTVVLVLLILLFLLKGLLKFFQFNYMLGVRYYFMRKIRFALVDSLQDISYVSFLKLNSGRIHNTLVGEVQRLYLTMNNYFSALQASVMLMTYVVLAFLANFQFALFVAIGAALSNILFKKIYTATKKISIEISKKGHDFNSYLVQAVHNYKYLKATNYFRDFTVRLKEVIKQTELLNRRTGFFSSVISSVKEPIIIIVVATVIYLQINWFGANFTSILISLLLFYRSLGFLMSGQQFWQEFIQNIGAMDTVSGLLNQMQEEKEKKEERLFTEIRREVCLRNVFFSYMKKPVLKNISLNVAKNQTIAIVGESGSGKTTLANIIAGLIQPDSGQLIIDAVPLTLYNTDSYRRQVGYISQETVIFSDTIFNNVTFWAEKTPANLKRFWETIELASLDSYVNCLEHKEETFLGDNGLLISGGQKQRICIARELFKNVQLLIFDEATSSLDSETERSIQENTEKLHGKFTVVIIAHRLSTIKYADTIYLVKDGAVADSGTFEEMLVRSQQFKYMVSLQDIKINNAH
jgi:ABC-type multidrug transport system fused ATPase/permease subunit